VIPPLPPPQLVCW